MKRLIIGAVLLGMNGCTDIQKIGFVPWSQAAARFQRAYTPVMNTNLVGTEHGRITIGNLQRFLPTMG